MCEQIVEWHAHHFNELSLVQLLFGPLIRGLIGVNLANTMSSIFIKCLLSYHHVHETRGGIREARLNDQGRGDLDDLTDIASEY